MRLKHQEYLRSIFFGIEDSLVSTTGLVAGVSVGADNNRIVLLAGIVAITIEAVSMGVGEYLSDDAAEDLDKLKRHKDNSLVSGLLMFLSYLTAGIIPLAPLPFLEFPTSLIFSVLFALVGLFTLGYLKGKLVHTASVRGGLKILVVGGIATLLGIFVGFVFKI